MIDGDFFQSVAHVTYSDNMELHHNYGNHPDISNVIMYAKTEDQDEALQFMEDSRSDFLRSVGRGEFV